MLGCLARTRIVVATVLLAPIALAQNVAVIAATPSDEPAALHLVTQIEGDATRRTTELGARAREADRAGSGRQWPERMVVVIDTESGVVKVTSHLGRHGADSVARASRRPLVALRGCRRRHRIVGACRTRAAAGATFRAVPDPILPPPLSPRPLAEEPPPTPTRPAMSRTRPSPAGSETRRLRALLNRRRPAHREPRRAMSPCFSRRSGSG